MTIRHAHAANKGMLARSSTMFGAVMNSVLLI